MKDFMKKAAEGWGIAIGSLIFLIILNVSLMGWTRGKFPTEYNQGWEGFEIMVLMFVIIPASLLASLLLTGLISLWRKQKPKAKLFFWTAVTTGVVLLLVYAVPNWIERFERINEAYFLPENLEEQRGCVIRGSRTIEEKDGLHYVSYSSACRQAIGELFTGVHLVYEPNIIKIGQKMIIEKHTYEAGVLLKSERSSFCGDVITDGLFESKCEDDHVKGTVKNSKLEGTWLRFHENGNMSQRITYRNDLMHGTHETFYDSGEINWKRNYKDGELDGRWESFFKDGSTNILSNWKNGERFYENDQLKETGNYKNGKQDGP